MTDAGRRLHRIRKVFAPKKQRDIHECNQYRNLYEGADHCGEGLAGIDAENGNGYGNGQLKIVRCGGKAEGGRLFVGRSGLGREIKRRQKHEQKIDAKRNGDAHDVKRQLDDVFSLE